MNFGPKNLLEQLDATEFATLAGFFGDKQMLRDMLKGSTPIGAFYNDKPSTLANVAECIALQMVNSLRRNERDSNTLQAKPTKIDESRDIASTRTFIGASA